MRSYLPYYFKRIGIGLVLIAFILSNIGGINGNLSSIIEGWQAGSGIINSTPVEFHIIKNETGQLLTWISLLVSFSGFLCYMFSKEREEDEFIQKLRFISLGKSLLITWTITSILFLIDGDIKLEGFYILQFQLIVYVIVYNYYKKLKFAFDTNS